MRSGHNIILFVAPSVSLSGQDKAMTPKTHAGDAAYHGVVNKSELTQNPDDGLTLFRGQPFYGTAVTYFDNNVKSESGEYRNGKKHGTHQEWYPNGKPRYLATFEKNRLSGLVSTWWSNGALRSQTEYLDGLPHGVHVRWYVNGVKFQEMRFVNGRERGMQRTWRVDGTLYSNYQAADGKFFGLERGASQATFELSVSPV